MANVHVKLRRSVKADKEGVIYYQITHSRLIRQLKANNKLLPCEWDERNSKVANANNSRCYYLQKVQESIDCDVKCLRRIINYYEEMNVQYTADDIIQTFQSHANEMFLCNFMRSVIAQLRQLGKQRTSETYLCTLKSFMRFRENKDILLEDINSDLMLMYEAYLQNKGLTKNSTSFYMRILRAVYNRAIEKNLTANRTPFKHVYTGIDKTIKRAIPLSTIKKIKGLDLSLQPSLGFVRDIFMFSFYTRGMSFIDLAYLKKKDITNGILSYRRRKTGQQLFIRWEICMQEIVDKYQNPTSEYLLPIFKSSDIDKRKQYRNALYLINRKLKVIGTMVNTQIPLTMYTARHSWASIAKSKNIPISVISEGMGHDSEKTTQIYLSSLDTKTVDKANLIILNSI